MMENRYFWGRLIQTWLSAFFCLLEFSWFPTLSLFFLTWVEGLRAEKVTSVQTVEPPPPPEANCDSWFWATQIRNCLLALPFYFHIEQTSIRVKIECLLCTVAFPQSCDGIYVNHHEALQAVSKLSFFHLGFSSFNALSPLSSIFSLSLSCADNFFSTLLLVHTR